MRKIRRPPARHPEAERQKNEKEVTSKPNIPKTSCQAHNTETLSQVANIFFKKGEVCEVRAIGLNGKGPWDGWSRGIVSGYFNDFNKLEVAVDELTNHDRQAEGIYFTLNPVNPALIGRADNRLKVLKNTTTDKEIVCQRWLLVDIDPNRPAGVSATEEELEIATCRCADICEDLTKRRFPEPIMALSGNGGHLLYKLPDLPNTTEITNLKKQALQALQAKFGGFGISVDQAVFNPARITKLYNTWACKGENIPDRPHRKSEIRMMPKEIKPVTLKQLQQLANQAPKEERQKEGKSWNQSNSQPRSLGKVDVRAYLNHYKVPVVETKEEPGGVVYCLQQCLFDPNHGPKDASIIQADNGMLLYQCFHDSCSGHKWKDARKQISGEDSLGPFMVGGNYGTQNLGEVEEEKLTRNPIKKIIETNYPQRENVMEPWLPVKGMCMIYSTRGAGKTHLALAIAEAISSGNKLMIWDVKKPRGVLYIDGESDIRDLKERLYRMHVINKKREPAKTFDIIASDLESSITINMGDKKGQALIEEQITGDIDVIIFDNLSCLQWGGEENTADKWEIVLKWFLKLKKAGKTILLLHHSGKDKTRGSRGTSSREDAMDTIISLDQDSVYTTEEGIKFIINYKKTRGFHGLDARSFEAKQRGGIWESASLEHSIEKRVQTLYKAGYRQKYIAEKLERSAARISQIIAELKDEGFIIDPKRAGR